jgi:glycosyltransferase involved in cell wall biosynthesis
MKSIIAIIPKHCLGFGGAFSVYEGLSLLPEVELQTFETFNPTPDTKLVIGFGYSPSRKEGFNYKTSFLFCSPILQCEFSNELNLLNGKIQEVNKGILDYLFLLHKPDADALSSIWGDKIKWLPPLFNKKLPEPQFENRRGICCGGINRGNKNFYNQALAVTTSKYKDEGLYTFGNKPELFRLSKSLFKQDWNWVDWKPNEEYYNILRRMKLGLQVSLSESFCYFVLELALLKIPSIVSKTIGWYADDFDLNDNYVVENPNDPIEIRDKINNILDHPDTYSAICERSYFVAQKILKDNLENTKKILGDLIND